MVANIIRNHHFNRILTPGSETRGWFDRSISHTCSASTPNWEMMVHFLKSPFCNYCSTAHPIGVKFRYVFLHITFYQSRLFWTCHLTVFVTSSRTARWKNLTLRSKYACYHLGISVVQPPCNICWFGIYPIGYSAGLANLTSLAPSIKMALAAAYGMLSLMAPVYFK